MAITEEWAAKVMTLAVLNGQAAEMIECLWEGGTFTLDQTTGRFVMLDSSLIKLAVEMEEP